MHLMPGVVPAGSGCGGCAGKGQHRRALLRDPLNRFISINWPLQRVRSALVERAPGRNTDLLKHLKFFFAKTPSTKRLPPLGGGIIFGQVFGGGGMSNFQNPKVPPTGGPTRRNRRGRKAQSRPAESAGCIPRRHADRRGLMLVPGLATNHEAQPPLDLTVQERRIS